MSVPPWFRERRFGAFLQLSVAAVPGFAPVGQSAEWYWAHWAPKQLPDLGGHPALPEVQAWHTEHHPDVSDYDDFVADLGFGRFDAGAVVDLVRDAGMRYLVPVAKHHDGFCWWNTAYTDRNSARVGPHRDVLAELAGAARSADVTFGVGYSLLDWAHPFYDERQRYAAEYLLPQVHELVERFRPAVLWGDGQWGRTRRQWDSDELADRYRSFMADAGLPSMVNDRWQVTDPDVVTFDRDLPVDVPSGPWELRRSLSHSYGFNRAERAEDHLAPADIVALLTEVVAKGGNLLLSLAPQADGTLPETQQGPLRTAGRWIGEHADLIHGSSRFDVWGDAQIRYLIGASGRLCIVDLRSQQHRVIAHLSPHRYPVEEVDGAARWFQDEEGLHLEAPGRDPGLARVFRVRLRQRRRITLAVRGETAPGTVTIGPRRFPTIGDALVAARPAEVVLLGRGRHGSATERFPLTIAAGVTLKGTGEDTVLDGEALPFGAPVVQVGADEVAVEQLTVRGGAPPEGFVTSPAILISGGYGVRVERCTIDGSIAVHGGAKVSLEWNVLSGGNLTAVGAHRLLIRGNRQHGLPTGVGIHIVGGDGHRIEANTVTGDVCAVRLDDVAGAQVSANLVHGRWWSLHLESCTDCEVSGNRAAGMRAFTVTGGVRNRLTANVAEGTDTGVLLEGGTEETEVTVNHLNGCRIGVLAWDHIDSVIAGNHLRESRDHDRVDGPILGR